jgi:hypothetical protein
MLNGSRSLPPPPLPRPLGIFDSTATLSLTIGLCDAKMVIVCTNDYVSHTNTDRGIDVRKCTGCSFIPWHCLDMHISGRSS